MAKVKELNRIEMAIESFKNGQMVIVVDDEDRENEGDFIIASEKARPEDINFMMKEARNLQERAFTRADKINRALNDILKS